ncbi:MAG: ABC transporter ATP-binding protein [Candidatus Enteromonas sp.]|nr:ABC transporter ATP-binding protein [Candidatus Enteromonas sp.]
MSPSPRMQVTEKLNPKDLQRLFAGTKKYWPLFAVSVAMMLVSSIISVIAPNYLGQISQKLMDAALAPQLVDMEAIFHLIAILGVLYGVSAIVMYVSTFCLTTAVQHYCHALRQQIARKINRIPLRYFDSHATGDIMSRVTNDVDSVSQNLDQSIANCVSAVFLLLSSLIAMFLTNWFMALIACASIPLLFVFMAFELKIAQPAFQKRAEMIGKVSGIVEEDYGGQNVIKLFNAEKRRKATFDQENRTLGLAMFVAQDMGGLMHPTTNFISLLGYAAVLIAGGLCAVNGKQFGIDMAVITAFLTYIRLFQQPFTMIGQTLNSLQVIGAASRRVHDFLGEEELEDESHKPYLLRVDGKPSVQGKVEFDHVSFGYEEGKEIIHDFSATILPGMKVAIVGPTGAGKTTMVNLLMRFYEISSGSIRIDGKDIRDMKREEIHDIFGMVLQDTWVFDGTYRDNLVYNAKDVKDEEILRAIQEAHLVHFTRSLPDGLDTVFGENSQISAGQKQLITIARAMIRKSPLLILDEATSNVDTRTEEKIQEAMDRLANGRTSFVIAHRLSTIRNADLILVMNQGNIVEQGTHEELLAQNGFYAGLYNSQFALE